MDERKEPDLGRLEDVGSRDRIPTLTEIAFPENRASQRRESGNREDTTAGGETGHVRQLREGEPSLSDARAEAGRDRNPPADATAIDESDIEAAADRILDRLAPVLREMVSTALQDLLARRPPQD